MITKEAKEKRSTLIRQRLRKIISHPNFWVSLCIGGGVFLLLSLLRLPPRHSGLRVIELSGAILTFTSMGFAVSLTAVALILAMPLGRTTALLVLNDSKSPPVQVLEVDGVLKVDGGVAKLDAIDKNDTGYLGLVAVFLTTALVNVFSSAVVIIWSIFIGGDELLSTHKLENNALSAIVAASLVYSGLQMVTAVRTLYRISNLIQRVMRDYLRKSSI